MIVPIRLLGFNGEQVTINVSRDMAAGAKSLVYAPDCYFTVRSSSAALPISSLIFSHLRTEGIANAVGLMRSAYEGSGARRIPISVSSPRRRQFPSA